MTFGRILAPLATHTPIRTHARWPTTRARQQVRLQCECVLCACVGGWGMHVRNTAYLFAKVCAYAWV